jgi:hypothetical protein
MLMFRKLSKQITQHFFARLAGFATSAATVSDILIT